MDNTDNKDNKDLLTVKEFAAAAGVTVQAIYPRIKGDLKPYFKEENGQKLIDKAGLELFIKSVPLKDFKELEKNFKELEKSFKETLNQIKELEKELESSNKELEKQLEIKEIETTGKDKLIETRAAEIETLKQQLTEKDKQISLLQAALTAAQTLQAMEKQERLQLTQGGHDQSAPGGAGQNFDQESRAGDQTEEQESRAGDQTEEQDPPPKKGLISRLFSRIRRV